MYGAKNSINLASFASGVSSASPRSYDTFSSNAHDLVFPGTVEQSSQASAHTVQKITLSRKPAVAQPKWWPVLRLTSISATHWCVLNRFFCFVKVFFSSCNFVCWARFFMLFSQDVRQYLYKGAKLKNTPYVHALVAYTGKYDVITASTLNQYDPPLFAGTRS